MFKEEYTKENEQITPDESTKKYIRAKLSAETEKAKPMPKLGYIRVIAAVVCLVFAATIIFVTKNNTAPVYVGESVLMKNVTYGDIYKKIKDCINKSEENFYYTEDGIAFLTGDLAKAENVTVDDAADLGSTGTNSGNESSTTNNQVEGVDESDLVKNDGKYIYSINSEDLIITDSNNGDPKVITRYSVAKNGETVSGLFVNGNRLAVILSSYRFSRAPISTKLVILDVTDKENVKELKEVNQNGYYSNSRMIGDKLYLLSNYWVNDNIKKDKPETYVPVVDDAAVKEDKICMIDDFTSPVYLVVAAFNIQTGEVIDSTAVLGGAENVYCNSENLFYTFTKNFRTEDGSKVEYKTETTIVKINLGEELKTVATGKIMGKPLNQFSMDEYKGNLRVVATVEAQTTYKNKNSATASYSATSDNALYVLDGNLKQIGSIEELAEGERVYSVRFDKEIGYFVTFRQVDPLFTVDLSEPTAPKILSELKIPGFSEYLHPFGEGKLFGFGKSATELGQVEGLKISMFDVSDPTNVTENHVTLIDAAWSEASDNHKAIMVDVNKNLIVFLGTDHFGGTALYVYGYDNDNGFYEKTVSPTHQSYSYGARFVWIGDYFYLVTNDSIVSFTLASFELLASVKF